MLDLMVWASIATNAVGLEDLETENLNSPSSQVEPIIIRTIDPR